MDNKRTYGYRGRGRGAGNRRTEDGSRYRNGHYGSANSQTFWRSSENENWDKDSNRSESNRWNDQTYITIRADKIGKLIGKHGSQIKELQNSTGTNISIGYHDYDALKVTITGSFEGQEKCKELIKELTDDTEPYSSFSNSTAKEEEERPIPVIDWDEINRQADEYEKARWSKLPQLKKEFYFEHPDVANMSDEYVEKLRKSLNNLTVRYAFDGTDKIPNPVETFEQAFSEYPEILREIRKQGFEKPFPIQCQAWPILLSGKDMIGIAQTGTGKTLAFLLPALIHIDGQETPLNERGGPNVLILAPTRELALQIDKEVEKYSYRNIKSICVFGGGDRRKQVNEVKQGVQIVTATPGRLNDLVQNGIINIESITYLVLDEADKMLDMGFEPQIRKILLDIRPDRQTIMTSATWSYLVQNIAQKYTSNPIQVIVGSLNLTAVHSVKQTILFMRNQEKMDYLMEYIRGLSEEDKIIVFVDKKVVANGLSCDLVLNKIDCQSIHGDREQADREQAIDDLKTGAVKILIATDVASRGIDITDITKVVNYDFPKNIEEYVHRVGRTGRAGRKGEAVTFFTKHDSAYAKELISILEEAEQEIPDELYKMRDSFEAAKSHKNDRQYDRGGRKYRQPKFHEEKW
ncbi:UNVERIFIED_CONTAM: hypothetical protein PYX00_004397 [Menopon gallinae]|uniref:RNA helicase n=1 Tax=Menopon gallinae TaxID=328185 RepID=A0AAW2I642_9NEOP